MNEEISELLNQWTTGADPRSMQMFLIKSPYPVILILATYFLILKVRKNFISFPIIWNIFMINFPSDCDKK